MLRKESFKQTCMRYENEIQSGYTIDKNGNFRMLTPDEIEYREGFLSSRVKGNKITAFGKGLIEGRKRMSKANWNGKHFDRRTGTYRY